MKTCTVCLKTKDYSLFSKRKALKDGYRSQCKECDLAFQRKYEKENRKTINEKSRIVQEKLRRKKGKLTRDEWKKEVSKKSLGKKVRANKYAHKRRSRTLTLSEFDLFVFEEAINLTELREKSTNFKWHLDHIVPLMHKKACGLHVAYNFQVVPAAWNVKKGNRNMDTFFPIKELK